jgi:tetratricopeptide (TPR) repeat protein
MAEPGGEDPKDFIDILNLLLRANDLRARGRFEEARRTCLEVLADRPDNLRALQILGDVSIMRGEFESAVAYYSRYLSAAGDTAGASPSGTALSRNADLAEVHYNLGNSLHRLRRFESAADHYRQAIRLWDEIAPARNSLGALLAEAGRLREAIDHFHRALEIDPTLKSAQDNLARAEELLNRRDQGQ